MWRSSAVRTAKRLTQAASFSSDEIAFCVEFSAVFDEAHFVIFLRPQIVAVSFKERSIICQSGGFPCKPSLRWTFFIFIRIFWFIRALHWLFIRNFIITYSFFFLFSFTLVVSDQISEWLCTISAIFWRFLCFNLICLIRSLTKNPHPSFSRSLPSTLSFSILFSRSLRCALNFERVDKKNREN